METTKETAIHMRLLPKIFLILSLTLTVFIVGRRILRSYCAQYIDNQLLAQILGLETPTQFSANAPQQTPKFHSDSSYNFGRLVHLIEESIEVKHRFYAAYLEQARPRKYVDIEAMKDLLAELYREKVRLDSYIFYLRDNKQQSNFIDKRERSLNYFKKVLLKNIKEIEIILKKI
ncbi:MAG: hypothetical protein WCT20_02675 [Candidatus Babeliales bacterium]|jgi:hypothetical protein